MSKINKYVDLTCLKPDASPTHMEDFITMANQTNPFAVCIAPTYMSKVLNLKKSIKVCTVLNFPLGIQSRESIMTDYLKTSFYAVEFDIVLPLFLIASWDWELLDGWCKIMRQEISQNCLKGIIEIGYWDKSCFGTEQIKKVCEILIKNKWNFVKTSTGLGPRATTIEDIKLLKKYCGSRIKIKAAGGIKDAKFARELIKAGASRIGTSSFIIKNRR